LHVRVRFGERVFDVVNICFMLFLIIIMLYPFINLIALCFSGYLPVISGRVTLWPVEFQTQSFMNVVGDQRFVRSFFNTVGFTLVATALGTVVSTLFAYPLSKRSLRGRGVIMKLIMFLMLFGGGGLIPNYLLMKNLHLLNTYWALWLPGALSLWNVIIYKNFFQELPVELEESAVMDGAKPLQVFIRIIFPLSLPVIAALSLFTAVGAWNTFFGALIYLSNSKLELLQQFLQKVVQSGVIPLGQGQTARLNPDQIASQSVQAAAILCTTIPILCVYPFLQKYFVKGMMTGAIKG